MPPLYGILSQQTRRVLTPALRVAKRKFRTTGGETPPLQILAFVRRGCPKAPLREGGGAVRRQGESAQLRTSFLFWIPPAKLWVRQLYNFPHFAKSPQFRVLPHPLTREPLLTQSVNVGGSLAGDHWSPLRGVFPCVCTSSAVGGCCLRQLMSARLYGVSLGLGRVRPKLRVCFFPRPPRPSKLRLTEQKFAQKRRNRPERRISYAEGRLSVIKNGKLKTTCAAAQVLSSDFYKTAPFPGILADFPGNRSLKCL